jgi:Tfp pilus assembly protein PilZ
MPKDFNELRKHPRVNVDFFADWGWGPECENYDKITSLSLGGCFLATKRELRARDEIYIRWTVENIGMISLKGSVRYQTRVMEGSPPTGAGIEFVSVSSESQKRLQAVMDNQR